jgi:hypothetical protein
MMATETPGQKIDLQAELDDLLCIALDGADTDRVRYLVQFIALRQDQDREADLARIREAGIGPVWTL